MHDSYAKQAICLASISRLHAWCGQDTAHYLVEVSTDRARQEELVEAHVALKATLLTVQRRARSTPRRDSRGRSFADPWPTSMDNILQVVWPYLVWPYMREEPMDTF